MAHTDLLSLSFLAVVSAVFTDAHISIGSCRTGGELERAGAVQVGYTKTPLYVQKSSVVLIWELALWQRPACAAHVAPAQGCRDPLSLGSSPMLQSCRACGCPGSLSHPVSLTLSCLHSRVFQTSPSRGGNAARTPANWTLAHSRERSGCLWYIRVPDGG